MIKAARRAGRYPRSSLNRRLLHLVEGVHGQQHDPGHVQRLDDLIGHGGLPRGAAATQPCTHTHTHTHTHRARQVTTGSVFQCLKLDGGAAASYR